jgi:hypothetical protein
VPGERGAGIEGERRIGQAEALTVGLTL